MPKRIGCGSGNNQGSGVSHHSYKDGNRSYYHHKKKACERCRSKKSLCVHHKDRDRTNNSLDNLETLCKSCHQSEHSAEISQGRAIGIKAGRIGGTRTDLIARN